MIFRTKEKVKENKKMEQTRCRRRDAYNLIAIKLTPLNIPLTSIRLTGIESVWLDSNFFYLFSLAKTNCSQHLSTTS